MSYSLNLFGSIPNVIDTIYSLSTQHSAVLCVRSIVIFITKYPSHLSSALLGLDKIQPKAFERTTHCRIGSLAAVLICNIQPKTRYSTRATGIICSTWNCDCIVDKNGPTFNCDHMIVDSISTWNDVSYPRVGRSTCNSDYIIIKRCSTWSSVGSVRVDVLGKSSYTCSSYRSIIERDPAERRLYHQNSNSTWSSDCVIINISIEIWLYHVEWAKNPVLSQFAIVAFVSLITQRIYNRCYQSHNVCTRQRTLINRRP